MSLTSAFEKRKVCWLGMPNLDSMKHVDLEMFKLRSILVLGKHLYREMHINQGSIQYRKKLLLY
jgi:hypothetical protein